MTDLILDANSVYARAWFGSDSNPDIALERTLQRTIDLINPFNIGHNIDRILICWDGKRKNDKKRSTKPAEYYSTREIVRASLDELTGTKSIKMEAEADDVIATAVANSTADEIIVATGDKDLHQLSSDKVKIYCLNKKEFLTKNDICRKWGISKPIFLSISLALTGDKSDAIEGIAGVGPKKAYKILESIKGEESMQKAIETIASMVGPTNEETFFSALNLTLLDQHLPGVGEPQKLRLAKMESPIVKAIGHMIPNYESTSLAII